MAAVQNLYTPETSCIKETSVHYKNLSLNQLWGLFLKSPQNFSGQ